MNHTILKYTSFALFILLVSCEYENNKIISINQRVNELEYGVTVSGTLNEGYYIEQIIQEDTIVYRYNGIDSNYFIVKVKYNTPSKVYFKNDHNILDSAIIKGKPYPNHIPRFRLTKNDLTFDGNIILRPYNGLGSNIVINDQGELEWVLSFPDTILRAFNVIDNEIISLRDSTTIETYNQFGFVNRFELLNEKLHHEVIKKNKFIYTLGYAFNNNIKGDKIIKLDSFGNVVWTWNIFDYSKPKEDSNIDEWGHANSLEVDDDGNILVSFRDFNQIWKIDGKKGDVLWKLGKGGDFDINDEAVFYGQHSIDLINSEEILMFDNGHAQFRSISRVLSIKINEVERTATLKVIIDLPEDYTSYRMGSAYLMNEDHVLVCSAKKLMSLAVFNVHSGKLLWEVKANKDSYRAIYSEEFLSK